MQNLEVFILPAAFDSRVILQWGHPSSNLLVMTIDWNDPGVVTAQYCGCYSYLSRFCSNIGTVALIYTSHVLAGAYNNLAPVVPLASFVGIKMTSPYRCTVPFHLCMYCSVNFLKSRTFVAILRMYHTSLLGLGQLARDSDSVLDLGEVPRERYTYGLFYYSSRISLRFL